MENLEYVGGSFEPGEIYISPVPPLKYVGGSFDLSAFDVITAEFPILSTLDMSTGHAVYPDGTETWMDLGFQKSLAGYEIG